MGRRTLCNAIGTHAQHRTVWDRSLHASAKTYVYIYVTIVSLVTLYNTEQLSALNLVYYHCT